jgi:hypothetical protein
MFTTLKRFAFWAFTAAIIGTVVAPAFADLAVGNGTAAVSIKNTVTVTASSPLPISVASALPINVLSAPSPSASLTPAPVAVTLQQNTLAIIDHSGTITAANVPQVVAVANPNRHGLTCQNPSGTNQWIDINGGQATSAPPSIVIYPSSAPYTTPINMAPTGQIMIISATASAPFMCKEY